MPKSFLDRTTFKAPLYVAWEITHRCNARCLHCYSASGPDASTDSELTTRQALSVIDQLAEAGLLMLAFSGGEPILRKDWESLVVHAVRRGLGVNVGTNGSTITPGIARRLNELGVKSVTVSIDSHRPDVHDHFRQFSGLFWKATEAVRLLVEAGVRVVVGFTPTKLNWRDGEGVIKLARRLRGGRGESLGIRASGPGSPRTGALAWGVAPDLGRVGLVSRPL